MNGNGKYYFRVLACLVLFCCFLGIGKAATPVFTAYRPGTITEGLPPGSPYYTFIATDANPGDVVTYSLESKALEWFNINSTTGVATVKKTIDREVMRSVYRYKVFASDGTDTAEADVIQQISDINDNPPLFSNLPKTINISESSPVGSLVFTVTATDADLFPANVMEFAIEAGNEEGRFEFPNLSEGKINLKKPLDYDDGTRQFLLRIIAKNTQKDPKLNSTAVLTINVQNVDDLGAKFEKNLYEAKVIKDSLPGTVVTTVQAEDRDGLNATVEYSIYQETNPGNTYKVNINTGEITVNGPLTIGTQMLVVTATSTKHPPTFTVVRVTVTSSRSNISTQTISTMRPSTIAGIKTTAAIMPNNITEVSASLFIIGFVILGIILALNTFLLGYIIWRGQKERNYKRIKNDSKRNGIEESTNIALEETGDIEFGDSSQNVTPVAAESRNLPGPASVARGSAMGTDYEDVNTNQTPIPLQTYQALIVSPSSDQSSHAYESLHKYGENSSSSTTI